MEKFVAHFSMIVLCAISAALILVVLLQRGRGGGLAGAFGGLGGQSAFGTKAGDVFTKITIGLVTAWVLLAGISGVLARKASTPGKGLPTEAELLESKETDASISSTGDEKADDTSGGDSTSESEGGAATGTVDSSTTGGGIGASSPAEPAESETPSPEADDSSADSAAKPATEDNE